MASQDSATSSAAIKVNATAPHTSASVHLLPCCIDHQGGARVSTFFRAEQTDEGALPQAAFRGRMFRGHTAALPEGVKGVVLRETAVPAPLAADTQRYWVTDATFNSVTCWKHDAMYNDTDLVPKALTWMDVASTLHGAVSEAELAKEMAVE